MPLAASPIDSPNSSTVALTEGSYLDPLRALDCQQVGELPSSFLEGLQSETEFAEADFAVRQSAQFERSRLYLGVAEVVLERLEQGEKN